MYQAPTMPQTLYHEPLINKVQSLSPVNYSQVRKRNLTSMFNSVIDAEIQG